MNKLSLSSPLKDLYLKKIPDSITKLEEVGITSIFDIFWIFPHSILKLPSVASLNAAKENEIFKGTGTIKSIKTNPNFWAKGKKGIVLQNITMHVEENLSKEIIVLKWFNTYPSIKKKLQTLKEIVFWGTLSNYKNQLQIVNPEITSSEEFSESDDKQGLTIRYPTINTVNGNIIKKIFEKIPSSLWDEILETLPTDLIKKRNLLGLKNSIMIIHGLADWSKENEDRAKERLIYEEFFTEQVKVICRREKNQLIKSKKINVKSIDYQEIIHSFPFTMTEGQINALSDIQNSFQKDYPMMRLLQGDVGCGKTAVAVAASLMVIKEKKQVAFMCPTETLAWQHYQSISSLLKNNQFKVELLLGSTPPKQKNFLYQELEQGRINLIIGTHSLIQENVKFSDLGLLIIDEQHKFGVNQRLKLLKDNLGTHCLIMTATPIPRSLRLTQYGDLDISTITQMPLGRKPIKTKIITPDTFKKFLTFINTRLTMQEQIYVVVPAIMESENLDIMNLETVLKKFSSIFSSFKVEGLHGQMKSDVKAQVFNRFKNNEINILIATSVVEVGIDVPNATVMAIINPERFGLSSLHQLRGRVGRGGRPGFFFLINDKNIGAESMKRLNILENHLDGFKIAEEDLKIRGEGDLFGVDQSGAQRPYKLANIILHSHLLNQAKEDLEESIKLKNSKILNLIQIQQQSIHVTGTI